MIQLRLYLPFAAILIASLPAGCAAPDARTEKTAPAEGSGGASGTAPAAGEEDEQVGMAHRLVDNMAAGKFEAATADFDETMTAALPAEKLAATWEGLTSRTGPFRERTGFRKEKLGAYDLVFVRCVFERVPLDVKVVLTPQGEVTGLFFVPATPPRKFEPPPYARPRTYEEKEVTVGAGEWALPGTLTLPLGEGPFAGVVLVHGSGPNDRDETIGPNKPFRDIAWGLASRGIAVLRYEKRTRQHSARLLSPGTRMTVKEETIDDALSALDLLRNVEQVDGKRVFFVGHSLGGMLLPRIAKENPEIAGLVIMAGTTRPLDEVILDQFTYLAELDGSVSEEERSDLDEIERRIGVIRALDPGDPKGSPEDLLGVPPEYWIDLREYEPAEVAKGVEIPMLILQGERDYQVTMADLEGWKQALSGRDDVEIRTYPAMNHLFIRGEGTPSPNEYEIAGHVGEEVIGDIVRWISAR